MTDMPDHHDIASPLGNDLDAAAPGPAAGIGVRAIARVVDFVLVAIVNAVVVTVLGDLIGALLGAAISLAYFAYLESSGGQTLGKMVMKLRTVNASGQSPSLEQAIRRNIWVAFGAAGVIPFIGGLIAGAAQLLAVITIAVGLADDTSGGRGWHDRFAGGTRVVSTRASAEL